MTWDQYLYELRGGNAIMTDKTYNEFVAILQLFGVKLSDRYRPDPWPAGVCSIPEAVGGWQVNGEDPAAVTNAVNAIAGLDIAVYAGSIGPCEQVLF